jgi:L-amino acid N-acyltransferase YncA
VRYEALKPEYQIDCNPNNMAITIRPATIDDIPQVHAINTHYVLNTVITFQQTPSSLTEFIAKFKGITARGLPFLVAIEISASKVDQIIGYAYLSPFRGPKLSYAPTVELSIFLNPTHTERGTGSLLLSALLSLVSSVDGIIHRALERSNDSSGYDTSEDGHRIRNVLAVMALDPEEKDTGEWLCQWYAKRGFIERGRLAQVGFKNGKW